MNQHLLKGEADDAPRRQPAGGAVRSAHAPDAHCVVTACPTAASFPGTGGEGDGEEKARRSEEEHEPMGRRGKTGEEEESP